jgi:hypothetical protein
MTEGPSIFDEARRVISRSVIEAIAPGGTWKTEDDYWPVNPSRSDSHPGSFHISAEGVWHDFTDDSGGTLIDLVMAMRGCTNVDAAEEIIRLGGGAVPERKAAKKKPPKPTAIIPIPDDGRKAITELAYSDWARKVYGSPVKGWRYHLENGDLAFVVIRYDDCPDGSAKQHTQFYWSAEGAKNGMPPQLKNGRPLYRLHELVKTDLPILIVEGEKCADVAVEGYFVTTWCGGASSVDKTDWAPLEGRAVTVWPDSDEPGMKAAMAIKNRIPTARVLDVMGEGA